MSPQHFFPLSSFYYHNFYYYFHLIITVTISQSPSPPPPPKNILNVKYFLFIKIFMQNKQTFKFKNFYDYLKPL
jgi:hypothetical protein